MWKHAQDHYLLEKHKLKVLHTCYMVLSARCKVTTVGEDMGRGEHVYTAGRNVLVWKRFTTLLNNPTAKYVSKEIKKSVFQIHICTPMLITLLTADNTKNQDKFSLIYESIKKMWYVLL